MFERRYWLSGRTRRTGSGTALTQPEAAPGSQHSWTVQQCAKGRDFLPSLSPFSFFLHSFKFSLSSFTSFLFNFFPSSFPSHIIYSFIYLLFLYLLISPFIFYHTFICQLYFLHSSLFSFYYYLRRSSLRLSFLLIPYLFIYLLNSCLHYLRLSFSFFKYSIVFYFPPFVLAFFIILFACFPVFPCFLQTMYFLVNSLNHPISLSLSLPT
jgi:hypothetical protein